MQGQVHECARWFEHELTRDNRPELLYSYFVTGHAMFPVDMLRHDRCWPCGPDEGVKLGYAIADKPVDDCRPRCIRMLSYQEPTVGRWSSFGWSVGKEDLSRG